jgi:prolyl 4-hydroxylase
MAIELNDFIRVYDNALDHSTCDFLIKLFDDNEDEHEIVENNRKPNFTQFNLTKNISISTHVENAHNLLISNVFSYKKEYYNFVDERCFPKEHAFEQFRIKRYLNNDDQAFDCHVDVVDYDTSRRFLSFLWYLNDVEEGGETIFSDLRIKPSTGKLVVFPPLWMFPHIGKSPISNSKYILSTYLHYK